MLAIKIYEADLNVHGRSIEVTYFLSEHEVNKERIGMMYVYFPGKFYCHKYGILNDTRRTDSLSIEIEESIDKNHVDELHDIFENHADKIVDILKKMKGE